MKDIKNPKKKNTFKEKIKNNKALFIAIGFSLLCIALIPICCCFFNENPFLLDNILLPLLISLLSGDIIYISINKTIEIQNEKEKKERLLFVTKKFLPYFFRLSHLFLALYKALCSSEKEIKEEIIKFPLKNTDEILKKCKSSIDLQAKSSDGTLKFIGNGYVNVQYTYREFIKNYLLDFKKNLQAFILNYGIFVPINLLNKMELLSNSIILCSDNTYSIATDSSKEDFFTISFGNNFSSTITEIINAINKITKKENFEMNENLNYIRLGGAILKTK